MVLVYVAHHHDQTDTKHKHKVKHPRRKDTYAHPILLLSDAQDHTRMVSMKHTIKVDHYQPMTILNQLDLLHLILLMEHRSTPYNLPLLYLLHCIPLYTPDTYYIKVTDQVHLYTKPLWHTYQIY